MRVHTGRRYLEAFQAAGATVVPWQAAADFDEHDLAAAFPAVQPGKGPRQMLANLATSSWAPPRARPGT